VGDDRNRALIEAGLALASELSLEAVLQRIVELAVEITGARYGALGVLTEEGTIEEFLTVGVTADERAAIGDPPTGHGLLGVIVREGHALRIPDIARDPRSVGFPPNHPQMTSFLGAPIVAHGRVFGRLYLTDKERAAFDEADEEALKVLATQAGVAVENARLYEEIHRQQRELQRLSILEERERIAKELHDGVIQSLFAVGMGLQGAAALARDEDVAVRIESAVQEIDHAIRDLRNYIFGLRPGILADRQLDQALRDLGRDLEERSGVVTVVEVDEDAAARLASRAADVVQIAREALANVGKHAAATTCRVTLRREGATAVLEIDDDGAGFDAGAASTGMGLPNLRERAASLDGELEIESVPGDGTIVRARLPL
jgi:signal transduction histidine kinase